MKKRLALLLFCFSLPAWPAPPAIVALAASARPESYWSFWRGETASGFRQKMLNAVQPIIEENSPGTKVLPLPDPSLPDQLYRDGPPWPRYQALCNETGAGTLLVLRVQDVFPVLSPWQADLFGDGREAPSAHWPALYLTAHDCHGGRHISEHPILSPRNADHFVFETDLVSYTRAFWKNAIDSPSAK